MSFLAKVGESLQDLSDRILGRGRRPLAFGSAAAVSDTGLVREENQDAYACAPEDGFLCVADGMGGGEGGALASRWCCEALLAASRAMAGQPLEARERAVDAALQEANVRIRGYAKESGFRTMGTTAVAVLLEPVEGFRARVFHVGDSRLYRFRNARLDVLTRDHTVGNELGRAMSSSSADQARSLQARSNPLTHILTRAVGTELRARPEWRTVDVQRGDRLMLCSDGVHDMLDDATIGRLLAMGRSPRDVVARIEAAVRHAGAGDNYTALCAFVTTR